MNPPDHRPGTDAADFVKHGQQGRSSSIADILHFVKRTRKWWMLPLIFMLLTLGLLMVLATTGAAPFIYTLF